MTDDNKIIQSLLIGNTLSPLELLTLKSFIHHGHEFHLYIYEPLVTPIPDEVILKDGNEIIPESKIFKYKKGNSNGLGKGSYAGFSDIFRYKLLYKKGGWWVDMDITCLKPLDIRESYFFRKDMFCGVVNNIIKVPIRSTLMKCSYEQCNEIINSNNTNWSLPSIVLKEQIKKNYLSSYISSKLSIQDRWETIAILKYRNKVIDHFVIHWMNEEWRKRGWNKQEAYINSTYHLLLKKYKINHLVNTKSVSTLQLIAYKLRRILRLIYLKIIQR